MKYLNFLNKIRIIIMFLVVLSIVSCGLFDNEVIVIQKDWAADYGPLKIEGTNLVDKNGNIVMKFNTNGMFRAWQKEGEKPQIKIFQ